MTEPFYHTVTIKLHIVYDGHFYFYNRHENGRIVIDADRISSERAANIMKLNDDDPAVQTSKRAIGSGWSWMASVNVQVDEETV